MRLSTAVAIAASAVYLVRLTPQPLRLARTGVAAGVSPLAAINSTIAAIAWVVYGLSAHLPAVWIVTLIALVPCTWTVALLAAHMGWRDLAASGAWVAVLVIAAAAGTFGVVLGLGVAVTQGPQVIQALRDDDLSGVSPATWWLSILDAITWGGYGLVIGDGALIGYGVVLSSSAVVVLARIWWTARQSVLQAP